MRPVGRDGILVVTPYNAQIRAIQDALAGRGLTGFGVGTVDKFQGREAPVVIYSMATSSAEGVPLNRWDPQMAQPPGSQPGREVCRGGSGRLSAGTTLVPDDGYRLLLGEPGAGGERLIEPGCAQPVADLSHQLGLQFPQMRPRR